MGRIAYVNGRFVPHAEAFVHIEDRGYQFADAVYEVWALFDGKLADVEGHFVRLARSLSELSIAMPMSRAALTLVLNEAVRRNRVRDGLVYLQVSRGVAPRDHAFPTIPVKPAVVITTKAINRAKAEGKTLGRPASLNDDQRKDVAQRLKDGAGVSALSRAFKTSRQTIMRIRDGVLAA